MVGKRSLSTTEYKDHTDDHNDLENGQPPQPQRHRFKDIANLALEDSRTRELKKALREGIENDHLEKFRKTEDELKSIKNKKVRQFYENQNSRLNDWLEVDTLVKSVADDVLDSMNPDADHDGIAERQGALQGAGGNIEELLPEDEREKRQKEKQQARWTINVGLDPTMIMVISFLQVLKESVQKIIEGASGGDQEAAELPLIAVGAMAGTVILKGIIWFACIRVKTTQVQALAQDCKTDVYFNTLSLLFPFIGSKAHLWWLDPLGASLLSLFIIYDWAGTCFENVTRLSGSAIDDGLQKKLTYLAYRFSPVVDGFKSLTAYHAGDGVWVEYDVLLDEKTPLRRAHDIAETLQYCAEGLSEVDRAFVTTDYASQGPTGHTADQA
ncbi:hypothetical protein MMC27_008577 [Xylographa pallens]|nr:hypothetical protein [Xylographa pallens]